MGGKTYYCDHCKCYMKNNINVRKTHNAGLSHIIAKVSHYRRYQDPALLYEQEMKKEVCVRYLRGACRYNLYCQYTHYTEKQLQKLKKIVDKLKKRQMAPKDKRNISLTERYADMLPWSALKYQRRLQKGYLGKLVRTKSLPESLKPINLRKLCAFAASGGFVDWG